MTWYVLSSTWFDFEHFASANAVDSSPRHLLPDIAEFLDAEIHQPPRDGRGDKLASVGSWLYGQPQHWMQARRLLPKLKQGDAVYAAGCDSGVPLAVLCVLARRGVRFAITVPDVTRVRTRLLFRVLLLLRLKVMFVVNTDHQARSVTEQVSRKALVHVVFGQTDCDYFRPASGSESSGASHPPLVASCGVERRDYDTLCQAMERVDARAEVCFASPNQSSKTKFTKPSQPPNNVDFRHMNFAELRALYQRADLVALPLLYNQYSAGLSTLFEAVACGTPVVVTRTPGVISKMIDQDLLVGVPAGDPNSLASEINRILSDPAAASKRAERARQEVLDRYSGDAFLERLRKALADFSAR